MSSTTCQLFCKKNFLRAQYAAKNQNLKLLDDPRYEHFSCRFHTGECSRAISVSAVSVTLRLLELEGSLESLPGRSCRRVFCGTPVTLTDADLLLHDVATTTPRRLRR